MGSLFLSLFFLGCVIEISSGYNNMGWRRCAYTKYVSCYKQRCCNGWSGSYCNRPICSPSCLNGGTCTSPGKCKCDVYHAGGHCQTELAICIPPCGSGGKCIRPNTCQCDLYHYGKQCQFKKSCSNKALELLFLLDSSGKIGQANFESLKSFVKTVIEQFDIAENKTRVGLMTFSRYPVMRFSLDDNKNMRQLLQEVDNVPYVSGLTETHTALRLLQQEGFLGSRSHVPHVAILITEGKSLHPNETKSVAEVIRHQGIIVFVIAVGEGISREELRFIATNPVDKHLFIVNNHTMLDSLKENVTTLVCDEPINITHARRNPIDECLGKLADVVFLLDSSKSLGASHFKSVDHFALDIVNDFDIGLNATLVGVISFSTYPVRRVTLGTSSDKLELLNSINQILYYPGLRETDRALQMLRLEGFVNDRSEAPNIAVVITNGPSSNSFLTKRAADELKQTGVEVFAVGAGDDIDKRELELISTAGGNHTFTASNYLEFDLSSFEGAVASAICQALPVLTTPAATTTTPTSTIHTTTYRKPQTVTASKCVPDEKDVIFLVDSSGSVGDDNFNHVKEFIKQTINTFDIGLTKTRVGLIIFNTHATMLFPLNKYDTREKLLNAVENIVYSPGGTNTGDALELLRTKGFSNGRTNAPHIAFLITDGYSTDKNSTKEQAKLAKDSHIQIAATGIGQLLDMQELSDIASANPSTNRSLIYHVDDFDQLHVFSLEKMLFSVICSVELSSPSPTTQLCVDVVDNCDDYTQDMCTSYRPWATANCKRYCGFCQGLPTPPKPCTDVKSNCHEFGPDICTSTSFKKWTKENCARFCGLCDYTTTPALPTTTTPPPACADEVDNCIGYDPDMCTKYQPWAMAHCRQFCGFCQGANSSSNACNDTIGNCREYGHEICTSASFRRWAHEHCARFCEFCGVDMYFTTTASPSTTENDTALTTEFAAPTLSSCYNKESNCESYGGQDMCSSYRPWAMENCEQYCGFCICKR